MTVILDIETDGLLDTLTQIFCAVAYDTKTKEYKYFVPEKSDDTWSALDFDFEVSSVSELPKYLDNVTELSMQNGIGFDFKVLNKIFNYKYKGKYVDTVLLSRILWPDLENIQYKDENGKLKTTRHPHSVEAWGLRFGIAKPIIEDYTKFTLHTVHRCKEDVRIQTELYKHITKTIEEYTVRDSRMKNKWSGIIALEQKVWQMLEDSADRGWGFDLQLGYQLVDELDRKVKEIENKLIPVLPKRTIQLTKTESGATKAFKTDGSYTSAALAWMLKDDDVCGDFCKVRFDDFNIGSSSQVKNYLLANGWKPKEWNLKKDKFGKPVRDKYKRTIKASPKVPKTAEDWDEIAETCGNKDIALLAERNKAAHRRSQIQGLIDNVRMDHRIEAQANTCSTNCVVAGTLIQTDAGNIPIERVQKGDLVLTHIGRYELCEDFIFNGIKPVYVIKFKDGRSLTCTGNHPIFTPSGFIITEKLKIGQECYVYSEALEWKKHPLGDYSVSNTGLVVNNNGYQLGSEGLGAERRRANHLRGNLDLYIDGQLRKKSIGCLVLETFVGSKPDGKECCHKDGNRANNHLENLYWGTSKENSADQIRHGTLLRANRESRYCKLTQRDVDQIRIVWERVEYYRGMFRDLGYVFGVTSQVIAQICRGERWVRRTETIKNRHRNEFITTTVISLSLLNPVPTYDITVANDHSYIANGVVTHNTSRMTHRIVVNIPKADPKVYYGKQMRSLFKSSEGKVLVGCDASALEARCEAHYTYPYDKAAALELIEGDIHALNAEIFQTTRSVAKNGKYAILYGCSPTKLASTIGKPLDMATEIYNSYWEGNPALKQLKLDLEEEYEKNGYLLAIDGRPLTIRYKHAIINTLFQSCGAIAIKIALCIMDKRLTMKRLDAKLLGVFHDECQLECSPEIAEEVGKVAVESIREAGRYLKLNVELDGEYKVGPSWDLTH